MDMYADPQVVEEIRARIKGKSDAYSRHDYDGAIDVYMNHEEFPLLFDVTAPDFYRGYATVHDATKRYVEGQEGALMLDYGTPEIFGAGDVAVSATVVRIQTKRVTGNMIDTTLRQTSVWKKVNDKWYVIHEHNSEPMSKEATAAKFAL